jgi:hypothetical protein
MNRMHRLVIGAEALLVASIGCGAKTPTEPSPATPNPPASAPASLPGTLSISTFTVTGRYDGQFHYTPALSVAAGAAGSSIGVQEVSFERAGSGPAVSLAKVRYVEPRWVRAGGALDVLNGTLVIRSESPIDAMTVRVSFFDQSGQSGAASADAAVPPVAQGVPDVTVDIQAFSVTGWYADGRFHYWPRLTIAETGGRGPVVIAEMTFELLDVGPAGRVPPVRQSIQVPAGGALTLDANDYDGGPWLEIDSATADASRVSVLISFADAAGRGGSVRAIAQVSR